MPGTSPGMTAEVAALAFSPTTSNLLIVLADFRMGAQHAVHHLEHVVHALLGDRALDHDDELRLVGGGAHQAPAAVLDRDADAVDGDEVADRLAADLGALGL